MVKCAPRSTILSFFAGLLLFIALSPVYGGGGRDADLNKADELIARREYDQAILILSDFARRNPDKFDQAQQRLRKIAQLRSDFNRYANELINTLLNDPGNDEKILDLTKRLNSIENEASPLLANFVSRTHEIAAFNVTRNQFRAVMERGRALLERGDCQGAVTVYTEGFSFMRDEFFRAGYGERIESGTVRETERLISIINSFARTSEQMGTAAAELTRAVNSNETARFAELAGRLNPAMEMFIALKQELYASANIFERFLDEIRNIDPEIGDRNHLSFISVMINGPADTEREGISGAFDVYWANSCGAVLSAITANIGRIYSASLGAFNAENYSAVPADADRLQSYVNMSPQFFERKRQLYDGSGQQIVQLFGVNVLREDSQAFLEIRAFNEASNLIIRSANIAMSRNTDSASASLNINADEAMKIEEQAKSAAAEMQRSIEGLRTHAAEINTEINNYHNIAHIKNALDAVAKLQTSLTGDETRSAQRYYTVAYNNIQENLGARRESLEKGRNYLNGQSRTGESGAVVTYRYPAEALDELTVMLRLIAADIQNGDTVLQQFRNEPAAVSSNPEISALNANYRRAVNELNSIRSQGEAFSETARSRSAQAQALRQEGERLVREAQSAYQSRNYETARERLQRASERFSASLEIQESASLRQSWDSQMVSLGQAIANAENENIITEVRELVNNARNLYFAGSFQQAEDNLVRARNRWRITNAGENEEVLYWLRTVQSAVSANTGRVIPATAPLYAEMSQLLSQAQRNYEEGVRLINAGRRTEGIRRFDEARNLTGEVRLMFPLNQEAGILELRIEQFTDPTAFNASFEQRIRTAIAGTRSRSIEAFADLQNLAEINPRYPNIRAIITQAEIDMGYRRPPPNPENIARSRELTSSVSRILEGNITTQYEIALTQIDEAITLNPDNNEAARVKDRLLNRMSVPGAIVLSSEDEEDYQRALRELQAGNNLVAFALVERLMQNPRNQNISKLIELQRRIQSIL